MTLGVTVGYGQVSLNGKAQVKEASVKLFPNPADDQITLTIENVEVGYIAIADIIGKEIKRFKANPEHVYDVSFLRRGIYFVHVLDKKEELIKPLRLSKS